MKTKTEPDLCVVMVPTLGFNNTISQHVCNFIKILHKITTELSWLSVSLIALLRTQCIPAWA